jgi:hypothetical protein
MGFVIVVNNGIRYIIFDIINVFYIFLEQVVIFDVFVDKMKIGIGAK